MFKVRGMKCGHCAGTVANAIKAAMPGVQVSVDVKKGVVELSGPYESAGVIAAIKAAGYDAEQAAEEAS